MTDPFAEAYEAALLVIEKLSEIDPKADSPEGRLLIGLADACEASGSGSAWCSFDSLEEI
jgi:hypothetical protein